MNSEQKSALEELFAHVPPAAGRAAGEPRPLNGTGFLETWFNLSSNDLVRHLETLRHYKQAGEELFLNWAQGNPLDAAFLFLGTAAMAFYNAEKGANPRIHSYVDAFYAIATCASVGQADIFAVTQTGRSIAALVMVVGPALAARTLNRPRPAPNGPAEMSGLWPSSQ
jgi:hypothetical protein